jgi:hypothetical protein
MGRPLLPLVVALVVAPLACTAVARAEQPTVMVIRNVGVRSVRVQVALGPAFPCDSSENRVVFDGSVAPGTARVLELGDAVVACARKTSAGTILDWGPSLWLRGGYRCGRGRGAPCWRDPSVPMRFDVE